MEVDFHFNRVNYKHLFMRDIADNKRFFYVTFKYLLCGEFRSIRQNTRSCPDITTTQITAYLSFMVLCLHCKRCLINCPDQRPFLLKSPQGPLNHFQKQIDISWFAYFI